MSEKIIVKIDEDLEEIIPMFLENRAKDLEQLKKALEEENFKAIEVIGHKLAGNAGSYGLHDLGEIGVALEKSCLEQEKSKVQAIVENYKDYLNRLEIIFE
jgi:HPt (histidine-containing phosphotransfer) domain-containing protein